MASKDCDLDYKSALFAKYRFEPSVAVNTLFMVLFILTTSLHAIQMLRTRAWYLTALVIGGCFEFVGYAGRLINALEEPGCWTLAPYIMQNLVILIAPALMAASIYMILGRIILLTEAEHHAIIKRRWLTKIFVTGDIISLFMQGSGGGMMASDSTHDTGEKVIIAGLFVQLAFFGLFIVVAAIFHLRMRRAPTIRVSDPLVRWQAYLTTLYVTGVLIWVRSLFRVIEFIQGNDGALMRSEIYVFVFDGLLMFAVLVWMNWFHPAEIGLLICGSIPISNGFNLLSLKKRTAKQRIASVGSSPSRNATVDGQHFE